MNKNLETTQFNNRFVLQILSLKFSDLQKSIFFDNGEKVINFRNKIFKY